MRATTLASIVLLIPVAQAASLEERVLHRLEAYEGLFDGCSVSYADDTAKTKFRLDRMGGRESLSINGKVAASIDRGLFARYGTDNKEQKTISIAYGTAIGTSVKAMQADLRSVLFWLGVRAPGDIPMSQAFREGKDKKVAEKDGRITASFATREDEIEFAFEWAANDLIPSSFTQNGSKFRLIRGRAAWPLTMEFQPKGKPASRLIVQEPRPLPSPPQMITIAEGDEVYDEHYNFKYTEADAAALPPSDVDAVLERGRAGKTNRVEDTGRKLLCGLDSIHYLSRLVNKPVEYQTLLDQLPEAKHRGATMEELRVAGRANGLNLVGYEVSWDELKRNGRPAILSWRPAHFVVFVPESNAIINPPFTTEVPGAKEVNAFYTGKALVLEP